MSAKNTLCLTLIWFQHQWDCLNQANQIIQLVKALISSIQWIYFIMFYSWDAKVFDITPICVRTIFFMCFYSSMSISLTVILKASVSLRHQQICLHLYLYRVKLKDCLFLYPLTRVYGQCINHGTEAVQCVKNYS